MYFTLYFNYKNRVNMCEASSKQYPDLPKIYEVGTALPASEIPGSATDSFW